MSLKTAGDSPLATSISPELLVCGLSEEPNILWAGRGGERRGEERRVVVLSSLSPQCIMYSIRTWYTSTKLFLLFSPHYTTSHHTAYVHLVRTADTLVNVRTHLPSIVSGCFRKSEGLTVNLLPATFRVTLSPESDEEGLGVGVASPLTLPSLELPLSGSESASW